MNRNTWIDALRALALLGVFIVNVMGYPFAPDYPMPLGVPQPIDAYFAIGIQSILIIAVQSKAWPLLSFLFGYSLCELALKFRKQGKQAKSSLHKRYLKLLLIGILHGTFLYYGDILTMYALAGLIAAIWALQRAARLISYWKILLFVTACLEVLSIYSVVAYNTLQAAGDTIDFSQIGSYTALLSLNASHYWGRQLSGVIGFLPIVLTIVVSGVLARRFNLLTDRRAAKHFWQSHLSKYHLTAALAVNLALGLSAGIIHVEYGRSNGISIIAALSVPAGVYLTAAGLAAAMRWRHARRRESAWVLWLAPAGRQTLAMYLTSSACLVMCSVVLTANHGNTFQRLSVIIVGWLAAIYFAKFASKQGWRDPITRYLAR